MKPLVVSSCLFLASTVASLLVSAQPASPTSAQAAAALTPQQMAEGSRAAMVLILDQALTADAFKLSPPTLMAKLEPELAKINKGVVLTDFNKAFSDTAAKVVPKVIEQIKTSAKNVKIDEPATILSGGGDAMTKHIRSAIYSSMREALRPAVQQASSGNNLVNKARAVFTALDPRGVAAVPGASRTIVNLEDDMIKQAVDQAFKLIAKREAEVRAKPSLLSSNPLAHRAFESLKK